MEIYIELLKSGSSRLIERTRKSGNTYQFWVAEEFDAKNRNHLQDLVRELNRELTRDRLEQVQFSNQLERELARLEIGRRISVRI